MDKNDERNKELEYVYNIEQIQYYAIRKMMPIRIGYNKRTNSPYLVYEKAKTKKVFDKWCKLCIDRKKKEMKRQEENK